MLELVLAFAISLAGVLVTAGELLPIRSNRRLHARCVLLHMRDKRSEDRFES